MTKSTSVDQLKSQILLRQGASPSTHRVKLISAGRLLHPDTATVVSFGIGDGSFVHAVVSKALPVALPVDEGGEPDPSELPLNPRGLDRLRVSARMSAEQVQAIRMAFRDSISQHSAVVPRGEEGEDEYALRVEEDWMRAQEEDSEYVANLGERRDVATSPLYLSEGSDMPMGSYRDFIYGLIMGFVLGIFMLVGIWDSNVTYRQKVGILVGVLLNLIMSSNNASKTAT